MSMSTQNSLKAATSSRVITGRASILGHARFMSGHPEYCPAGAGNINVDVYGRPVNVNSNNIHRDASCSHFIWPAKRIIDIETANRPMTDISASGVRGGGDFMGVGRDIMPMDLYDEGTGRGNFVQNAPWNDSNSLQFPQGPPMVHTTPRVTPRHTGTMDATSGTYYRG